MSRTWVRVPPDPLKCPCSSEEERQFPKLRCRRFESCQGRCPSLGYACIGGRVVGPGRIMPSRVAEKRTRLRFSDRGYCPSSVEFDRTGGVRARASRNVSELDRSQVATLVRPQGPVGSNPTRSAYGKGVKALRKFRATRARLYHIHSVPQSLVV